MQYRYVAPLISLSLEMTIRESAVPHSLEAPNPQPLIPSY